MDERAHEEPAPAVEPQAGPQRGLAGAPLPGRVLALQRTAGNRAVGRLLTPRVLARQPAPAAGPAGSKLVGLRNTLDWAQYKGTVPANSPYLAATHTVIDRKFDGALPGTASFAGSGSSYTLKDKVVITIKLKSDSWENTGSLSGTESRYLLDHEQGHYDIAALVARDMFIAVMALKAQTFASPQDGWQALEPILNRYDGYYTTIDNLYDSSGETGHKAFEKLSFGPTRKPPEQAKWEGYINEAFTTERGTGEWAPDGAMYKLELATVLRNHGHKI